MKPITILFFGLLSLCPGAHTTSNLQAVSFRKFELQTVDSGRKSRSFGDVDARGKEMITKNIDFFDDTIKGKAQVLYNGDFEFTYPNTLIPSVWTYNHGQNTTYSLDSMHTYSGKKALKMEGRFSKAELLQQSIMFPNGAGGLVYLNITHLLKKPLHKNTITVSAFIKTENITEGTAGLLGWVNLQGNLSPTVLTMENEITGTSDWKKYSLSFQVPENTFEVFVHCRLLGRGTVWFDKLELEINGKKVADAALNDNLNKQELVFLRQQTQALNPYLASNDFSDLQFLKTIISLDARIVGLGEGTHGTSEYFRMKCRLIRYLVQEQNFTLIGFEAFLLECEAINQYILTSEGDPRQALRGLMFWCWNTQEVLELIEWLRIYNQTATNKVKFVGIDGQFSTNALSTLKSTANKIDSSLMPVLAPHFAMYEALTKTFRFIPYTPPHKDSIDVAIHQTERLNKILFEKKLLSTASAPTEQVYRLLESARVLHQQMMCTKDFSNSRDLYYAANTSWFIDKKYPNEKIILWAHNWHVSRTFENRKSMGYHLAAKYGDKYVPVGFVTQQGTYTARNETGKVQSDNPAFPAEKYSIESFLHLLNEPVLYMDLRKVAKAEKASHFLNDGVFIRDIGSESVNGNQFRFLDVPKLYDGIIFFENTKGSTLLSRK
jgi:erythromycin esterase